MTSNLHIESQTTKKYDLPLSHLDYSYIEKCSNVRELEKILSILRSGDEGMYPDLEKFAEKRLETLNPKSHVLRKESAILRAGDLEHGDWKNIQEDLKTWTHSMHKKDSDNSLAAPVAKSQGDIVEVDENLPPVRSTNIVLEGKKQKKPVEKKKKKVMPRDYKEWDKFDVEEELKSVSTDENKAAVKTKGNGVSLEIDTTGMSEEEKDLKANREKDKGNEAFRCQDFDEAVIYYSRSISLMPIAASYNNRALAYLKLKKWDKAIRDCNSVLNIEVDNIKALMRRGTAYKSKKDFKKACADLDKVLELESNNKKAEDLLKEVRMEMTQEEKERKERGGRRMVIEEVDSEDDDAEEEIEVDKPVVNGYGPHDKCVSPLSVAAESDSKEQDNHGSPEVLQEINSSPSLQQTCPVSAVSTEVLETPPLLESSLCNKTDLSQDASSNVTSPGIPEMCSQKDGTLSPASNLPPLETSALPSTEALDTSLPGKLSQQDTSFLKSEVFSSHDKSESSAETAQVASQETSIPSVPCAESQQSRPLFVQLPLPPVVSDLKDEGNILFRSGQYGEAIEKYYEAIVNLEKGKDIKCATFVTYANGMF
uniref:Sperm-associated antigen 1 n=1 Tax=Arion vulgaris TaxID=1028688 RepID=A0A0B7B9I2_9EUPU